MLFDPLAHAVIGISVLLLWRQKDYVKVLMGLLYILLLSDNLHPILNFAKDTKLIYMLLVGVLFIFNSRNLNPKSKLFIIFLPFVIYSFLVLVNSGGNLMTGLQKTISYTILLIAVPSLFVKAIHENGKRVLIDFVYLSCIFLLAGIAVKYVSFDFVTRAGRFCGLFGNPNGLGIYLLLFYLFFRVANYFNPGGFSKGEKLFIYGLLAYNLFLCSSRSAMGGVIFFYAAEKLFRVSGFVAIVVLILGLFSVESFFLFLPKIITFFNLEEYFRLQTLEEGSGRFIAWEFAWQQIQDKFFFGGGFGYDEFVMRKNYDMLARLGHLGGVHNSYLSFWFDFGLVGIIIYFRSFFLAFIRAHKNHIIALPLMFTVMFSITFESWLVASLNPYTIQMFMMLAVMLYVPHRDEIDTLSESEETA
ncbi:MAG: O-antigen ligase family protein [Bacteroidia bacterium]